MAVTILLPLDTISAAIADQVRVELALELARVDVAVSTRATPADVTVTDDTYRGSVQ